jgi:3-deoxy-7-phosphoheptulonate synthase
MLLILRPDIDPASSDYQQMLAHLHKLPDIRLQTHQIQGQQQTLTEIYLLGNTARLDRAEIESLAAVERVVRISDEYRILGRHRDRDRVSGFHYNGVDFSQEGFQLFAGLCAVDNRRNVETMMKALHEHGLECTRMGAYKPRTSPYAFQGHGADCLPDLFELAGKYGIKVIAMEVTHEAQVEEIDQTLERLGRPTGVMLQIGTRNTQNFELLKALGRQQRYPILLKRGFGITLNESLNAAEYLASEGNSNVIFCLRGMKSEPDAARRHRLGQDVHRRQGGRAGAAADAGAGAQQDAGGAALRRVQVVLPRQRDRVLRQLLRLLPARGLRADDRHVHREGRLDQRGDRAHAQLGDRSLMERRDVLIVASISCIYGLGSPETYRELSVAVHKGQRIDREVLLRQLVAIQFVRDNYDFQAGRFRVRGDVVEVYPSYEDARAIRIEMFGDEIEAITAIDPLRGEVLEHLERITIYPTTQYVATGDQLKRATESIEKELDERLAELEGRKKLLEAQRLGQRTPRPRDAAGDRHLPGHRELQPPPRRPFGRASRRRRCCTTSRTTSCW